MFGNSKDKALLKDSSNNVDGTIKNPHDNPNNAAQHQSSQNSSHNSSTHNII